VPWGAEAPVPEVGKVGYYAALLLIGLQPSFAFQEKCFIIHVSVRETLLFFAGLLNLTLFLNPHIMMEKVLHPPCPQVVLNQDGCVKDILPLATQNYNTLP